MKRVTMICGLRWMMGIRYAAVCLTILGAVGLGSCSNSPAGPVAGGGTSSAPASPSTLSLDQTAKIEAMARGYLADGVTGAIVSISDPSRGSYLKAYGTSDTAGTPMTTGMHYRIASVSKTFTANAVLRLADQQKLSLDDPIAKYVPPIPHGDRITVRNLLAMRGGVYSFTDDAGFIARWTATRHSPDGPPRTLCRSSGRTPATPARRTRRPSTRTPSTYCSVRDREGHRPDRAAVPHLADRCSGPTEYLLSHHRRATGIVQPGEMI